MKINATAAGKKYKENDVIAIIQTYYGNVEVPVLNAGKLIDSRVPQGGRVRKGDIIAWVE